MDIKKNRFLTLGTDIIAQELMENVKKPFNNHSFKPRGGLWASIYEYDLEDNEWFNYFNHHDYLRESKINGKAAIITLKDDSYIFVVDTEEKLKYLHSKYPSNIYQSYCDKKQASYMNLFDYAKVAEDFDGIYIDYPKAYSTYKSFNYGTCEFKGFSLSSLILFNCACIEKYESLNFSFPYYNDYIEYIINERKTIHEIPQPIALYYEFKEEMNEQFLNNNIVLDSSSGYEDYIKYMKDNCIYFKDFIHDMFVKYMATLEVIISNNSYLKKDDVDTIKRLSFCIAVEALNEKLKQENDNIGKALVKRKEKERPEYYF